MARPSLRAAHSEGPLAIPPILLEGDHPGEIAGAGAVEREEPAAEPATFESPTEVPTPLPEAYGTRELVLTARDPHWLHAHWDFTADQRRRAAAESRDGNLALRVFREGTPGEPGEEVPVAPEWTHRFVHVGPSGGSFVAELGYHGKDGAWKVLCTSNVATTPAAEISGGAEPSFATIPFDLPMSRLVELARGAVQSSGGLAATLEQLRREGHPDLPAHPGSPEAGWTAGQEAALAEILAIDSLHRLWLGSQDITDLVQGPLSSEAPSSPSNPSSPSGGWEERRDFWFNINAELVLYGSTEPGATVTIGERRIKLREDGSFTFRFSLPDGEHELPVKAVSAAGDDARRAKLKFARSTEIAGEVGKHPQDPSLKPPRPENLEG